MLQKSYQGALPERNKCDVVSFRVAINKLNMIEVGTNMEPYGSSSEEKERARVGAPWAPSHEIE